MKTRARIQFGTAAALLLLALSRPACAVADPPDKYQAYAAFALVFNSQQYVNSPDSATMSLAGPWQSASATAAGASGSLGQLGTYAMAGSLAATGVPVPDIPVDAVSSAWVNHIDGFIAGDGSSIDASMNLYLDGALSGAFTPNPGGTGRSKMLIYSRIEVIFYVKPQLSAGYYAARSWYELSMSQWGGISEGRRGDGFLLDAAWTTHFGQDTLSGAVQTSALHLPVNQPFELSIGINSYAYIRLDPVFNGPQNDLIGTAASDFSHTLALLAATPVLGLPSGFSFDAPSVGIVNNLCTGPACVAPVPEPEAFVLWLLGLLALAGRTFVRRDR